MTAGLAKIKGTQLYYRDHNDLERLLTGDVVAGTFSGKLKVKGTYLHYMDNNNDQRRLLGTVTGDTGTAGKLKVKGNYIRYIDNNGDERELSIGQTVTFVDSSDEIRYGGYTGRATDPGELWATLEAGAGTLCTQATLNRTYFAAYSDNTNQWSWLYRPFLVFDTRQLPDTATVTALKIRLYGYVKEAVGNSPSLNIYQFSPTDKWDIDETDFVNYGTTAFSTTIAYADWQLEAWNDFELDANGIAEISLTDLTVFGAREVNFDVGASTPTWAQGNRSAIQWYGPVIGTLEKCPQLVVTYE